MKAEIFIIYRGFFVALIATPAALIYYHIFPWQFYAIAIFQGLLVSYSDYRYFRAFHRFGAQNVNAVTPLSVFIVFILWLILAPETISMYLKDPVRSVVIISAITLIIFSVIKYRNHKIGRDCLKEVFPILLMSALINVSNKVITEYSDGFLLNLTITRVAITGWVIGFVNLLFNHKNIASYKELINPKNVVQGWFVVLLMFSMTTTNFAMNHTPNPAYVTSIFFLSIVWIIIINKICKLLGKKTVYQQINLKWIFLLIFATIILVLATNW